MEKCSVSHHFCMSSYYLPHLYFFVPSDVGYVCYISSPNYNIFTAYFTNLIVQNIAPLFILLTLCLLTRTNLRSFTACRLRTELERQMTSLVLRQAFSVTLLVPSTINIVVVLATTGQDKSVWQTGVESLITQTVTTIFNVYYSRSS